MAQFSAQVLTRITKYPATTNFLHGILQFKDPTRCYSASQLSIQTLEAEYGRLNKYFPTSGSSQKDETAQLQSSYPNTLMFHYVKRVLDNHPPGIVAGLRKGGDGMHLAGFFVAAQLSLGVNAKYHTVHGAYYNNDDDQMNLSQQNDSAMFVHAIHRVRLSLHSILEMFMKESEMRDTEFEWLDNVSLMTTPQMQEVVIDVDEMDESGPLLKSGLGSKGQAMAMSLSKVRQM